ncbi:tetratricopeptide repeat protein [Actinorugispora endophytica]|uniref:Tetratricopeptide repeat protein n=1 Tax=Actinorugispora endophytica TaxID=1605990 RepID=A0A4R6URJ4_9ACTN|nr:tetratricopeptide repeat protein [Actinorugispora endophytica]TDQ49612.1 tetratricopeptide repeat protein [Actinorugispora endophytica]
MATALTAAWHLVLRTTGFASARPESPWETIGASPAERAAALARVLEDHVVNCGSDHPRTIAARNNLASKYSEIGLRGAAIAQFEQALDDAVKALGEEHAQTDVIRENLAWCYEDTARFDEAASHWERLVRQRSDQLGARAADTVGARAHLALAYRRTGRFDAAIAHYERALADSPDGSPGESESLRIGLALALRSAGRPEDSCPQFRMVLAQRRRRLGARHHQTLTVHHQLGRACAAAGHAAEAVRILRDVYRDCLAAVGDPEVRLLTLKVRRDLAAAYRAAGRPKEAAALY